MHPQHGWPSLLACAVVAELGGGALRLKQGQGPHRVTLSVLGTQGEMEKETSIATQYKQYKSILKSWSAHEY